ncbi:hypothetical protein [Mucilaginibacter aquaedulcis]|uniref:hypothetical protein n=1 Tax=Mucilaginibacter aquaedulcis TaxID=1187081 RepID=UPI0025B38F5A|nr:hypothetical protein [Mucilaginibacter aquaedulcis]MDN3548776.1 hypothetical protein [Mucilaginibacter aquaedulcis]
MATVNTGNVIVVRLKRVRADITDTTDPHYREAVDANGVPCRISDQLQATKPNIQGDADYIAPYQNLNMCPVEPQG